MNNYLHQLPHSFLLLISTVWVGQSGTAFPPLYLSIICVHWPPHKKVVDKLKMISCVSVHRPHFMWQVLTWFIRRKNQYIHPVTVYTPPPWISSFVLYSLLSCFWLLSFLFLSFFSLFTLVSSSTLCFFTLSFFYASLSLTCFHS